MQILTVNLVWESKKRGVYAPSPFALSDSGALAQASPRPLEPRAYDFVVLSADGGTELKSGFSVETLIKMEVSHAETCVGMTSDDLYLFQNRIKTRFLPDKHINYIDCALGGDGKHFAAAFSDLAGDSFAVAYGDISGKLLWIREFESAVTSLACSRDGLRVAVGLEVGTIVLLDNSRRDLWTFDLESPVRALACSNRGEKVAYAAADGAVGLIAESGSRVWESTLPANATAMALTGDGSVCGVLVQADPAASATICCYMQDGSDGWRHDTDRRTTGISLSNDGRYLAVGSRDGTVSLYELVPGERSAAAADGLICSVLSKAAELSAAGDCAQAVLTLKNALTIDPANTALHAQYLSTRQAWYSEAESRGRNLLDSGDNRGAIREFASMLEEDPLCVHAAQLLRTAREARAAELLALAVNAESDNKLIDAEQNLREAVAVAPLDRTHERELLAAFVGRQAAALDSEAEALQKQGDSQGALSALLRAQNLQSSAARGANIRKLQIDIEFGAGMQAYAAKQYSHAVFQFRKVLQLDKNHVNALRHLEFARRFSQETSTESLQDRFSRLE